MLHLTFMCEEQSCFIPSRSLVAKDLDGDGNEDLVVGSPGYSTSNEPQRGRVYILYSMYRDGEVFSVVLRSWLKVINRKVAMFIDLWKQKIITEEDFYIYYVLKFNDFFLCFLIFREQWTSLCKENKILCSKMIPIVIENN